MVGKCRHNYHEESEASINKQINIELNAHYQYLALVSVDMQTSIFKIVYSGSVLFFRLPITIVMTLL